MVAIPSLYTESEQEADELDDLGLTDSVREKIESIICRRVTDAVAGSKTRDAQLLTFDLQLECRLQQQGDQRWPNSSIINDPITPQVHLQMTSMVTQAQRRDPKWTVDADDADNDENASNLEKWLARKSQELDLDTHLYNVAYAALRDYGAVLYCGWKQEIKKRTVSRYHRITETGELEKGFEPIRSEERDTQNHSYKKVAPTTEPYIKSGCDIRSIEMIDFYLFPSNAQSIEHAEATCERILLTEYQLMQGVKDFGYDQDQVERLIELGPTHWMGQGERLFEIRNQFDGTSNSGGGSNRQEFYEVFRVFTHTPLHEGGDWFDIPEELEEGDLEVMVCPTNNIVFQMKKSLYHSRPYIAFYMISRPNRFLGKGVCQFLTEIQEELTHTDQLLIDAGNMEMSPAIFCPREDYNKTSIFQVYPGAFIPETVPGSMRPVEWNRNSIQMGIQMKEMLTADAHNLLAAEGYGVLESKVREKTETENMLGAVDTKFDLILWCMQVGTGMLGYMIPALHAQFDPDMEQTFRYQGSSVTITAEALKGEYTIRPSATSSTSSPQNRIAIQQAIMNAIVTYYKELPAIPPQGWSGFWGVTRRLLQELGVKNPEADLPEPQLPQPAPQPGAISPALAGLQQAGIAPPVQQTILSGVPIPSPGVLPAIQAGGGSQ